MTSESMAADHTLFTALRRVWRQVDPVPEGFVDDMVAAAASADLGRDYVLLTWVDSDARSAVRGDADLLTMQFSDGATSVLVHVTAAERGARRLDGWVDGEVAEVHLLRQLHTGEEAQATSADARFAFDDVPAGIVRLRIVLSTPPRPGAPTQLLTPRFEI